MLVRIFAWLAGIDLSNILGSVARIYEKRADTALGKHKADSEVAIELIKTDQEHIRARRDLGIAAMTHPVWWVAWALFVIPVGLHHAAVYLVSTFGIEPSTFTVLALPPHEKEQGRIIVMSIFGLQGVTGLAGALIQKFGK